MSYTEYQGWHAYFEARPIGWREDNRVMPLLQVKGVKAKAHEIFPSLLPLAFPLSNALSEPAPEGMVSSAALKKSVLFSKMLGASGGDKLPGMEGESNEN